MMKLVKALDYDGSYTYSVPTIAAAINTDEISRVVEIPMEKTRNTFDSIVRIWFKDRFYMDVIGTPEDFMEEPL